MRTPSSLNRRQLYAILKKLRRETGKRNIEWFSKYYFPHIIKDETPEFHREIYGMLKTEKRLGIAAPRGFAKSTITQIIYGLHCLLYNEEDDILTISGSAGLAEEWILKLKREFTNNERLKEDFGGILMWGENTSSKWTNSHLTLHEYPTREGQKTGSLYSQIRAKGRGCQVRGFRPTRVFADDLENDELVMSSDQRKKLRGWFLGALTNVLRPDQQLVVIGTVLHPLALIAEIMKQRDEFADWTVKKYKALTNGSSIWDARFPTKELKERRAQIGTYEFEREYQNNPISSDICIWREEWLPKYVTVPDIEEVFVGVDPAISMKESADWTGVVVWGVTSEGKIYELETRKGRWGTWEMIDNLIEVYLKYEEKIVWMGMESEKLEQVLRPVLLKESRKRGIMGMRIRGIEFGSYKPGEKRASRDKFSRALTVISLFEQGRVFTRNQDLRDELITFPTGDHDDLVDAAVHGIHLVQKHSAKTRVFQKKMRRKSVGDAVETFEVKVENGRQSIPCFTNVKDALKPKKDWRTL